MLSWLSQLAMRWARPASEEAYCLYGGVAAASRNAQFYQRYGIEDNVDGRFDTLTLMIVLLLRRLKETGTEGKNLSQGVIDVMFADMDLSLHELGVSENKVSKKLKVMARAFLGRLKAYNTALDADDIDGLASALQRNLYREKGQDAQIKKLATAVFIEEKRLAKVEDSVLLQCNADIEDIFQGFLLHA